MFGGKTTAETSIPVVVTPVQPVVDNTPIAVDNTSPVEPVVTRKPRKPKTPKVVDNTDTFLTDAEKFKNGLDKKKKPYFSRMLKEYTSSTDEETLKQIKVKIEKYMTKTQ